MILIIIKRNCLGFSLIEVMATLAVLSIVVSLLYAYTDEGWKLFYQSYSRGLSQVKAKLAIKTLQEELREANKNRIIINRTTSYGVPLPDDIKDSSQFIYFTKPRFYEDSSNVTGYDYILYYFAKPKEKLDIFDKKRRKKENENFLVLKSLKFTDQSKIYTEDKEKTWPFLPPILEIQKSRLPEDEIYLQTLKQDTEETEETKETEELFLDHFAKLKKDSRNIPISGNFSANSLTEPFITETVNIFFGQDYKTDKPIKIRVALEESPVLFGLMGAMTEFEVSVTPRN